MLDGSSQHNPGIGASIQHHKVRLIPMYRIAVILSSDASLVVMWVIIEFLFIKISEI